MLEEEFKKLLEKDWTNEEKELVIRIMDGLLYYKRFIPKTLKDDILMAIQLCNKLKHQLENNNDKRNLENENNENVLKINQGGYDKSTKDENFSINRLEELENDIKELRNEIEELKTIILIDQNTKNSKKYKFYKKIIKLIYNKFSKKQI